MTIQWFHGRVDGIDGKVVGKGEKGNYEIIPYGQVFLLLDEETRKILESSMNSEAANGVRRLQSFADVIEDRKE